MDQLHWLRRSQAERAMARIAATAQARLIHYELAGRYSVMAAGVAPFMLPHRGPATEGEREALQLPMRRKTVGPPGRGHPGAANDGAR